MDRRKIHSTINAAQKACDRDGRNRYVFATANGFTVSTTPPPRLQPRVEIVPITAKPIGGAR